MAGKNGGTSKRPSSVSDFKKKRNDPDPIELPSGCRMVLKRAALQSLIKGGQIPNELLTTVQTAINGGKKNAGQKVLEEISADSVKLDTMVQLMQNVVCFCAVDPEVLPIPEDEDDRDDEQLYVDELAEEDVIFIFQYVTGGTSDLATFRAELSRAMAPVSGQ